MIFTDAVAVNILKSTIHLALKLTINEKKKKVLLKKIFKWLKEYLNAEWMTMHDYDDY